MWQMGSFYNLLINFSIVNSNVDIEISDIWIGKILIPNSLNIYPLTIDRTTFYKSY